MARTDEQNQKIREESYRKIGEAGLTLFAEKGYFRTTMKDIAKTVGMSIGNLYWYFKSKEDLLKALLDQGFKRQAEYLRGDSLSKDDPEQRLLSLIDSYIEFYKDSWEFMMLYMSVHCQGADAKFRELGFNTNEIGMEYHRLLSDVLQKASQADLIMDYQQHITEMLFFSLFLGQTLLYKKEEIRKIPHFTIKSAVLRMLGYKKEVQL